MENLVKLLIIGLQKLVNFTKFSMKFILFQKKFKKKNSKLCVPGYMDLSKSQNFVYPGTRYFEKKKFPIFFFLF